MENASKALIIAGAILLAILIIGLGMYIYQQANSATSGTNLDPTKVQAYNDEFLQYEGVRTGTDALALMAIIQNHNRTNVDDNTKQISIKEGEATDGVEDPEDTVAENQFTGSKKLKSGLTYKITFSYSSSGYITNCYIIQSSDSAYR